MKKSYQRDAILEEVQGSCSHPTALEVYHLVRKKIPNISLGTVYRNLNALADNNYIKRVNIPNAKDHFDKTLINHAHVECINCSKVEDVFLDCAKQLEDELATKTNFSLFPINLVFQGLCNNCKKKEEK